MRQLSVFVILSALFVTACDAGKQRVHRDNLQKEESRTTTSSVNEPVQNTVDTAVVAPQGKSVRSERRMRSSATTVVPSGSNQDRINALDSDEIQAQEAYPEEDVQEQAGVYTDDLQAEEVNPRTIDHRTYNEKQISDDNYPIESDNGGETFNERQRAE